MKGEPRITPEIVREHDLTGEEYDRVRALLGREPTWTELGVFSVMWSEHCSYKSSRMHLRRLPTEGPRVLQGPGENAGVVDIGGGRVAVFKMESHNHPSYIEPYQGAATGVGGILRDIFTMGARPVASMNSLRFGDPRHPRTAHLLGGVVAGIAGYGNCIGVPTVGGEIQFHSSYDGNILVNVLNVGVADRDAIFYGRAAGPGNPVIYIGSSTGRDGIHGASLLASSTFEAGGGGQRPRVQVGDPFTEKLLLEACLEAMRGGKVVGIQDMGAAGLTCSTLEMAGRAGTGIDLDLDAVPRREEGMTPYELMLSESQERMLLVAKDGDEGALLEGFRRWGLEGVVVGRVTGNGRVRVRHRGETVADLPVRPLSEEAPVLDRPRREPGYLRESAAWSDAAVPDRDDASGSLRALLASPNIASKHWVYRQYDHTVRADTIEGPGSDAAVIRIPGTRRGFAVTTDGNSRLCFHDPFGGAAAAVAEAARNLSCVGAEPAAVTDCLNFGSPQRPEIMWQFQQAVEGIRAACLALEVPVVSGNVSFYNETDGKPIRPTPVIGMVGTIADLERIARTPFRRAGELLLLFGEPAGVLAASEYLSCLHGIEAGRPPAVDFARERAVQAACREAIGAGLVRTAHDVADGGLLVAVAECCFGAAGRLGAELQLAGGARLDALLFGEAPSRIVAAAAERDLGPIEAIGRRHGAPVEVIGRVVPEPILEVRIGTERVLREEVDRLRSGWEEGLVSAVFGAPGAGGSGGRR